MRYLTYEGVVERKSTLAKKKTGGFVAYAYGGQCATREDAEA